ncbi:MAG: 16S rRNA (adenine(1518)-N(6)/adenine(1519)-N(6))-dimethyltransferase RsmA [Desulfosudaceae bacterium]
MIHYDDLNPNLNTLLRLNMVTPLSSLKARGLKPRKSLGQNFLADPGTAETIIRRCHFSGRETILEIGAGTGALTLAAARRVALVQAVETDGRLVEILRQNLRQENLDNVMVIQADFMDTDLTALAASAGSSLTVIGNLPYYLSSQILVRLIAYRQLFDRAVLMFQQELADRLTAPPGGRDYGRLSVMLRYCAEVSLLLRVKRQLFFPRPEVDSQVIQIDFTRRETPADCPDLILFKIIKAAFGKRRKTIKNALSSGGLDLTPAAWTTILEQAGISPEARAETLDAPDYVEICRYYRQMRNNKPTGKGDD